ncbi:MAG: hypothetical protein M1831_005746 [Alyxoria varia]|nr:MAG: hypothetical protein M1831_005746 [Alyxoria varia]
MAEELEYKTMELDEFYVGQRLSYEGNICTVRYKGPVDGTKGDWLGVEWDDPSRGKHSGNHHGIEYFTCVNPYGPKAASFVRPTRRPDTAWSFVEALKRKYWTGYHGQSRSLEVAENERLAPLVVSADEKSKAGDEMSIRISGKEVEEVGFENVRRQLANLAKYTIAIVDTSCVHRPDARSMSLDNDPDATSNASEQFAFDEYLESLSSDVQDTCPNTIELDLSRNLFEEFMEIVDICRQLPKLRTLWLDGNRFKAFSMPSRMLRVFFRAPFNCLTSLSLDDTLIEWHNVMQIVGPLELLETLSLCGNGYKTLPTTPTAFLPSLNTIRLNRNLFASLSDVCALCCFPKLAALELKSNEIANITAEGYTDAKSLLPDTFQQSVEGLDLSSNAISSWSFASALDNPHNFQGLKFLRLNNNPVYDHPCASDGSPLDSDDAYVMTVARLARLERLNFSPVGSKERFNAENWYLSQIHAQLRLSPGIGDVLSQHPRYDSLCAKYGIDPYTTTPALPRHHLQHQTRLKPNSVAVRLVRLRFHLDEQTAGHAQPRFNRSRGRNEAEWGYELQLRLPLCLQISTVLGYIGQFFKLQGELLRLVWETKDVDLGPKRVDQEDEDTGKSPDSSNHDEGFDVVRYREETLTPTTRSLETWFMEFSGDDEEASMKVVDVRVESSEVDVERRKRLQTGLGSGEEG